MTPFKIARARGTTLSQHCLRSSSVSILRPGTCEEEDSCDKVIFWWEVSTDMSRQLGELKKSRTVHVNWVLSLLLSSSLIQFQHQQSGMW